MYQNQEPIYRPRTWGRGVHFIYDKNKRLRRHARRFVNWYFGYIRKAYLPTPIVAKDGKCVVEGFIKEFGMGTFNPWEPGFLFVSDRGCEIQYADKRQFHDFLRYEFERAGMPCNYDREAELYDDMCYRKCLHAFKVKHEQSSYDFNTLRDEIIKIATKDQEEINRKNKTRVAFAEYQKLTNEEKYEFCSYKTYDTIQDALSDYLFDWHFKMFKDRFCREVEKCCKFEKNTQKANARQLRALGFVA